jgi:tetratricopeptide (TPR) repeat protein
MAEKSVPGVRRVGYSERPWCQVGARGEAAQWIRSQNEKCVAPRCLWGGMTTKTVTKGELVATARAIALGEAHEAEVFASPAGRESDRLRRMGREADAHGDWTTAHGFFAQAVACFDKSDLGAGATSAAYDLAISLMHGPSWQEREMLSEAEHVLRRCLASGTRMREPMRAGRTFDALGQVLRRRALGARVEKEEGERLVAESLQMSRRAIEAIDGAGPVGWREAAGHRLTCANTYAASGDHRQAIKLLEEALDLLARLKRFLPNDETTIRQAAASTISIQAAHTKSLFALGRPSDLKRVVDIANSLRGAQGGVATQVHLCGVRAQLALGAPAKARERLEAIEWDGDYRTLAQLGRAAQAVGDSDGAVSCLRRARQIVLEERSQALADHVADECATEMQRFAHEEAAIHITNRRHVDAFLAYENSYALRYHDRVSAFAWAPSSPVLRALHTRAVAVSHVMVMAQDLGARLAPLDDTQRIDTLAELLIRLESAKTHRSRDGLPEDDVAVGEIATSLFEDLVREVLASRSILGPIHRVTSDLLEGLKSLNQAMINIDRHVGGAQFDWTNEMSPEALHACLVEHPRTALMRVVLEPTGLVAVCVWLASGELAARSVELPLPAGALRCLLDSSVNDGQGTPNRELLAGVLRELDLSAVYPDDAIDEVVLLPSTLAALVPWAAAGRIGHSLLDRFESISYLPMLTPMVMRQAPRRQRAGTVVVMPGDAVPGGGTHFHGLAYSVACIDEDRVEGAAATAQVVLEAGRNADVVSVFAHGEYKIGSGPILQLADGSLRMDLITDDWAGCERVELWACRSGVNLSLDHLTPHVNEAFGADIRFHQVGVRSTIGTLWSVNDLVTALIARRFRAGLAGGMSPARALTSAQRWWRDEAVPQVAVALHTLSDDDAASERIMSLLGGDAFELARLGPVAADGGVDRAAVLEGLAGPKAWAGYRFVGVADRRPSSVADPAFERPLSTEERGQVDALFAEALGADHHLVHAFRQRREASERAKEAAP